MSFSPVTRLFQIVSRTDNANRSRMRFRNSMRIELLEFGDQRLPCFKIAPLWELGLTEMSWSPAVRGPRAGETQTMRGVPRVRSLHIFARG
jgi:hypothetical protein